MANKQIYQLTETLSVSPDDWLAIDLDSSNLTRKARVGNVFSVSEGSSYTGGTANGIIFNDGDTFATNANLTWNTSELNVNVGNGFKVKAWSISGSYGAIANNSGFEMMRWLGSALYINYSNPLRFTFNDSERGRFSNTGFSVGTTSSNARFHLAAVTDEVAQRIDLSNGQTADAFQINSYGNTGGDLLRVDSSGSLYTDNIYTTRVYSNVFRDSTYGNNWVLFTPINISTSYLTIGNAGTAEFTTRLKSGGFYDVTDGTNTMRYQGGSLGIGTTSPTTGRLQIVDADVAAGGRTPLALQTSTGQTIFSFYNANSNTTPVPRINGNGVHMSMYQGATIRREVPSAGDIIEAFDYLNVQKFGVNTDGKLYLNRTSADATIHATNLTDIVAQRIDLSNGQTADAFQINSYGNTGGDLFKVEADGALTLASTTHVIGDGSGGGRIDFRSAGFGSYIESNGYNITIRGRASSGGGVMLGGTSSATDLEISRDRYVKFYNIGTPTSPDDGAMWYDGTDFKVRLGGVTRTLQVV